MANNVTTLRNAFSQMRNLVTAPYFDTSTAVDMRGMFVNCNNLENIPIYDTSNLSSISGKMMEGMFTSSKLTDQSLDNLLVMCINAPSDMPGRNLASVGLNSTYYPASRIQALPHYQEFISANWSIGY